VFAGFADLTAASPRGVGLALTDIAMRVMELKYRRLNTAQASAECPRLD
jgi:hypothetical protein